MINLSRKKILLGTFSLIAVYVVVVVYFNRSKADIITYQNPEVSFSETFSSLLTSTPSNILCAQNWGRSGLTKAHLKLNGKTDISQSYSLNYELNFDNVWSINQTNYTGDLPPNFSIPTIGIDGKYITANINGGNNYSINWTLSGTATRDVRPVLIPRYKFAPFLGNRKGVVFKIRNDSPLGVTDPDASPYGENDLNLKKMIDSFVKTMSSQSNNQLNLSYDIVEVYWDSLKQVQDLNCNTFEELILENAGMTEAEYKNKYEWSSFTMYQTAINEYKKLTGVDSLHPQGCAPYGLPGNWYPDINYQHSEKFISGLFTHEFAHTLGFGHINGFFGFDDNDHLNISQDRLFNIFFDTKDRFDTGEFTMGSGSDWFSAPERESMGWLRGKQVITATKTGIYDLYGDNSDFTFDFEKPLVLQVPVSLVEMNNNINDFIYLFLPNSRSIQYNTLDQNLINNFDKGVGLLTISSNTIGGNGFDSFMRRGKSLYGDETLLYTYDNSRVASKKYLVPGNEIKLLWNGTNVKIKPLSRVGIKSQVMIVFNDDPEPVLNNPPTVSLQVNDGSKAVIGQKITLNYSLIDNDSSSSASFYYDTDNQNYDGTKLEGTCSLVQKESTSCIWDTTGVPVGNYYIYAIANDGLNEVKKYSDNYIALTIPPPIPPLAPSNLEASITLLGIKLTVKDNSTNEEGFEFWRKVNNEQYALQGTFKAHNNGTGPANVIDRSASRGKTYSYQVRSFNTQNGQKIYSTFSNIKTIRY